VGEGWGKSAAWAGPGLDFGGFGFPGHGCEGDLGGIEELAAVFVFDGPQERAVGGAGDEVADVPVTREWGHGQAEGFAGTALSSVSGLLQGGRVNFLADLVAKGDGGVFEAEREVCQLSLDGRGLDGLDHEWFLRLLSFYHRNFDCAPERRNYLQAGREIDRVRRVCAIFDPGR
jgi:hypothetical protein